MIIYEVILTISNDIFHEYYDWLLKHVEDMLKFQGFQKAEITKEKPCEQEGVGTKKLTVRYTLESQTHLENYLTNHANAVRQEAIERFGDKFNAARRIVLE